MREHPFSAWSVFSVWNRNFQVYRKTWLVNCVPPLTEPLILLLSFGLGLSPLIRELFYKGQPTNYLHFLAPGMVAMGLASQSYFEAAYGVFIRIRFQKTWHALLAGPISYNDIFAAEVLWASTRGLIAAVVTAAVAAAFGLIPVSQVITHIPLLFLGSLVFSGLGVFSAGCVRSIDQLNIPVFLFIIPMFTLCGAYFPRETLPSELQWVVAYLPFSALVDLLRTHLGPQTGSALSPEFWPALAKLLPWAGFFLWASHRSLKRKVLA